MKKIGLYTFSCAMLAIYALSLDRSFMEWWADFRTYTMHAPYTRARYGDLYSNSYLPGFIDTAYIPLREYQTGNGKTDLYIIHDSYLANKLRRENFAGVNKLFTVDYRDGDNYFRLDTSRINILIIECSERTAEWRLTDTLASFSRINLNDAPQPNKTVATEKMPFADHFFNPNINQNLEFSLYDYEWFRPLKEAKAQINYSLFGRTPKDVLVSTDKNYLLLGETVDPSLSTSAFIPLDMALEDRVTSFVNITYDHFRQRGFDEVYFSIVPNPVTIVDPDRMLYNHKIQMLEDNQDLYAPYISTYFPFKNAYERIYRRDDSHWNGHGLQIWVDEVNKRLEP